MKPIPQTNPFANYQAHQKQIQKAVQQVLNSGWYILGEQVKCFEKEFAKYLGLKHAVGVASGTDAVELSLRACQVGPGDRVVTVSHTAVATVAAIERMGASVVFADIDPKTYTMSPESLEQIFKKKGVKNIKAVIPVHIYGQPADMQAILKIAKRFQSYVIEDCAQAHGASISKKKVGTLGDCGAFSFYPTKNLGAIGDGGIVVTKSTVLASKIQQLREYGWKKRYISNNPGINSRLDELQAAILRVKLKYLDQENNNRRKIASIYSRDFKNLPLGIPWNPQNTLPVYHQYVVRCANRDHLKNHLKKSGIITSIHYPLPVHLQPAYSKRIPKVVSLKVTEQAYKEILSLPMYPEMSIREAKYVAQKTKCFF